MKIPEPTHEQLATNAAIPLEDGRTGFACWYPQMGGYVSACVVVFDDPTDPGCFSAWVWHDGEFPFEGNRGIDTAWSTPSPSELHHCDASQFIRFGELVERLAERGQIKEAS